MKSYTISDADDGRRIERFVQALCPQLGNGSVCKYLRTKRIKVNGGRCAQGTRLAAGDLVELYINDEWFTKDSENRFFRAASQEVDVVYEDQQLIIANKPAGLVCHCANGRAQDNLSDRLVRYLLGPDPAPGVFRPALCNRLDRNTSGLVLGAKTYRCAKEIAALLQGGAIKKEYLCVCKGGFIQPEQTLRSYLLKDEKENRATVLRHAQPGAKEIVTQYRILEEKDGNALVLVELLTGRSHQIRAQMAAIGHPLLGDPKYGDRDANRRDEAVYQQLCAWRLTFSIDPPDGTLGYLNGKTFCAALPAFVTATFPSTAL